MREIEFMGKRIDNGEWVCGTVEFLLVDGDLTKTQIYAFIKHTDMDDIGKVYGYSFSIIPETIRQYTGFKDVRGNKIYEGDILALDCFWSVRVEYEKGSFMVRDVDKVRYNNLIRNCHIGDFNISEWKIIGNIYDNPELLEGEI